MAHGYLREYDEGPGDERERLRNDDREGGWRSEGRDRGGWHGNEPDNSARNRRFMLGEGDRHSGRSDWEREPRSFSSHQDDHYRSWRDKQMQALDRDYAEYCREREQQFHSDFDAWRNERGNQEPLQPGKTQTSQTGDPTGALDLVNEVPDPARDQPDPMASATLGTTSSRGRR